MDFRQYGIDERLLSGAPSLRDQALYHEKMLSHAFAKGENVFARLAITDGREAVFLLPALQWLASRVSGPSARILCLVPDHDQALRVATVASELGRGIGLESCLVSFDEESHSAVIEGNPMAFLVIGSLEGLIAAADNVRLKEFGFLLVDGGERIAELPSERIRHLSAALNPAWERKTIVVCSKATVKAKNLAWDLSDNPVEIHIEEEAAKAQSVAQETWHIASDAKLRFFLGLLARRRPTRSCVFCNLKSGAEELALRLRYNGVEADYILGSLPPDRKASILTDLEAETGSVLVLTDEGAAGLPFGRFPLVVNYDIPLDPELYVKRLEMLDRGSESPYVVNLACDRYVYGLPAVEQYIDAKLDAVPVEESLLRAEDKSRDLAFERPRFDRDGPRGAPKVGRLVSMAAREPSRPEGRTQGQEPRGGDARPPRRDEHRRRPGEGQDRGHSDRSPEIRRRISEATGGALEVDGKAEPRPSREEDQRRNQPAPHAKGQNKGQSKGQPQRDGGRGRNNDQAKPRSQGRAEGRQDGRREGKEAARGGAGGRQAGREAGRPREADQRVSTNPYELSMEERMKRYREKYSGDDRGGRAQAKADGDRRPNGIRSDASGRSRSGQENKRPDDGRPNGSPRPGKGQSGGQASRQKPPEKAGTRPAPPSPSRMPAGKAAKGGKPGLLGRIFGLGKKRQG
jgi:ATP-dependent RNA helicase RhlB